MPNEMDDYNAQVEQQEFIKEQGADAYADAIAQMFGSKMDPDKLIVMKEGVKALLKGPPMPKAMIYQPPKRQHSPSFEFTDAEGSVFLYDWPYITQRSSHVIKYIDGVIELWDGQELYIALGHEASKAFWAWLQEVRAPPQDETQVDAEFTGGPSL